MPGERIVHHRKYCFSIKGQIAGNKTFANGVVPMMVEEGVTWESTIADQA